MGVVPALKMSLSDDLVWEGRQPERHEFWKGDIFAMVGGKRGHGRIVANLMRHLGNHLDGTPCQAFSESMKVQVGDDAVLYPDVFVTCDSTFSTFSAEQLVFTAPVLVVDVLSPSTQAHDRSHKFAIYRRIASLREYALIDPDTRRVEVFRPGDDGLWNLFDMSDEARVAFTSVGFGLPLADLFKGMDSGPANG